MVWLCGPLVAAGETVTSTIVFSDSLIRHKITERWIYVCKALANIFNFNSLVAVINGINHVSLRGYVRPMPLTIASVVVVLKSIAAFIVGCARAGFGMKMRVKVDPIYRDTTWASPKFRVGVVMCPTPFRLLYMGAPSGLPRCAHIPTRILSYWQPQGCVGGTFRQGAFGSLRGRNTDG